MTSPYATVPLVSFDGAESIRGSLYSPDRYRNLESIFAGSEGRSFSVRGAGLSYANLSFGRGSSSIAMTQFNRFLDFDEVTGVVEVEAGMTLGTLRSGQFLGDGTLKSSRAILQLQSVVVWPQMFMVKNQFQDLNFKEQVQFVHLFHPVHGYIYCDRLTNPEVFNLTCGGFGLTGIVISVGIRLGRLMSSGVETETIEVEDIFQLPKMLRENSSKFDLLYSWHEFNTQNNWGHGFLKAGRQVEMKNDKANGDSCDLSALAKAKQLLSEQRGRHLPMSLLFSSSVWLMNLAYLKKELFNGKGQIQPLVEFLFPVLQKTVYFDLFGRPGFHETQVLIPFDKFEAVMTELRSGLKKFSTPVTLASCKLFTGRQELLRFIGEGIVLAMNFPRNDTSAKLLDWWDQVVIEAQGLPNLAKDSRLSAEVVKKCYPQYDLFLEQLHKWDPKRIFQTAFAVRLGL
ncbi:MAG: FAD-binding protein [Bdellovibrionales bacterium]|nr:FAD-binding protein [Bdellovibrionales bacterium]